MTTKEAPPEGREVARTDDTPTPLRPEVVEAYEAMITDVPEAGQEGFESILVQIATAKNARQLDAPWRSGGLEQFANRRLVVRGIRKMPSDFGGGLPWFLVIDGVDSETGEIVAITTGAVGVVAQLVKAHQLGIFPLEVIPRQSDRPSRSGYYPQHLDIVG